MSEQPGDPAEGVPYVLPTRRANCDDDGLRQRPAEEEAPWQP